MSSPKCLPKGPVVGERLHKALYEHPGAELRNIKFFRGNADVVTAEQMEDAVHAAILSVRTGHVQKTQDFPEVSRKQVEASALVASC